MISGTAFTAIVPCAAALPEITSTRPSASVVAVGYQRPPFMTGSGAHVFGPVVVAARVVDAVAVGEVAARHEHRPSGRSACPAQNRLTVVPSARRGCGVGVQPPLAGSQT